MSQIKTNLAHLFSINKKVFLSHKYDFITHEQKIIVLILNAELFSN